MQTYTDILTKMHTCMHTSGEIGSAVFWGKPRSPQYQKEHPTYWNRWMLPGSTVSSEISLGSELEQSLLIFPKMKPFFKMSQCVFYGLSESYKVCEGASKVQKVPFVTIVMHWTVGRNDFWDQNEISGNFRRSSEKRLYFYSQSICLARKSSYRHR